MTDIEEIIRYSIMFGGAAAMFLGFFYYISKSRDWIDEQNAPMYLSPELKKIVYGFSREDAEKKGERFTYP
jgi:hypothetical protein